MKSDIFILARLSSDRLPNKHLMNINEKPAIKNLIERLRHSKARKIVVCTTNLKSDDSLVEYLKKEQIEYFRGNDKDILIRFLNAAQHFGTDIIVDVSGDKIYTDVFYVDKIINMMENSDIDFIRGNNSNTNFDPSNHFIHGIIPGGIRTKALEKICELKKTNNTENGYTEFFISSNIIKKKFIIPDIDLEFIKRIKLDLDYSEDLELARAVFKELGNDFHMQDILQLFSKKPELIEITNHLIKKWKKNYNDRLSNLLLNNEN